MANSRPGQQKTSLRAGPEKYWPNVHRRQAASEKTGGREQRKYWVVELCLLEQKPQAHLPGGVPQATLGGGR